MRFLIETKAPPGGGEPAPMAASLEDASPLVADLLGATLVDAQDELWTAWRLSKRFDREQAIAWLAEPPPWPPASVAKYLGQGGRAGDVA